MVIKNITYLAISPFFEFRHTSFYYGAHIITENHKASVIFTMSDSNYCCTLQGFDEFSYADAISSCPYVPSVAAASPLDASPKPAVSVASAAPTVAAPNASPVQPSVRRHVGRHKKRSLSLVEQGGDEEIEWDDTIKTDFGPSGLGTRSVPFLDRAPSCHTYMCKRKDFLPASNNRLQVPLS